MTLRKWLRRAGRCPVYSWKYDVTRRCTQRRWHLSSHQFDSLREGVA